VAGNGAAPEWCVARTECGRVVAAVHHGRSGARLRGPPGARVHRSLIRARWRQRE